MLRWATVALVWGLAGAALADAASDCRSLTLDSSVKLTACDTLLFSGQREAWVYLGKADALRDLDEDEAALAPYREALALEPGNMAAHEGLALSLYALDRYDEALVHSTAFRDGDPDNRFSHYLHGRVLEELDRYDEAVVAFQRSVEIDPDYETGHYWLGRTLNWARDYEGAIVALNRAVELDPFRVGTHRQLATAHNFVDDEATSALHGRIAVALDPNLDAFSVTLPILSEPVENPVLPPAAYVSPADGLQIDILQVTLPREERDEMELAILDIVDWFSRVERARAIGAANLATELGVAGDQIQLLQTVGDAWGEDAFLPPSAVIEGGMGTFRGLLQTDIAPRGPGGPILRASYDTGRPADLWPLEVGNSIEGQGRFLLICPERFNLMSATLGCRVGVDEIALGTFDYGLLVERVEQVEVPAGDFIAYVVRYRQLAVLESMLEGAERTAETRWWIVPELGFWVKRTNQQNRQIATSYAVRIAVPD